VSTNRLSPLLGLTKEQSHLLVFDAISLVVGLLPGVHFDDFNDPSLNYSVIGCHIADLLTKNPPKISKEIADLVERFSLNKR
jgi:hypothetical protein